MSCESSVRHSGRAEGTIVRMGWDWALSLMAYDDACRSRRRLMQQYFHQPGMARFAELLRRTNYLFLRDLLKSPENFVQHIRLCVRRESSWRD